MDKTREFLLKDYKKNIEQNGWWSATLSQFYEYNINRVEEYLPAVNGVTSADAQAMAKKILSDGNLIKVVMRPEK